MRIKTQLAEAARLTEQALDDTAHLDQDKSYPYMTSSGHLCGQQGMHFVSTVRRAHNQANAAAQIANKILKGKNAEAADA